MCAGCRVDIVNHSASPSRRKSERRAIKCFQSQSAATEHPLVRRCAAALLSLPSSTRPRTPRSQSLHRRPSHSPSGTRLERTPGNSDKEQPFSYCYESSTQLRLESAANAHTAADLHVRSWVSYRAGQKSLERRERVNKYTKRDFYQSVIRRHCRTLLRCCNAAIAKLHTKFLNQRTESCAPQIAPR